MAIFYFNIFARCVDRLFLSHLQYQASSLSGKPEVFSMPQINRDRTVGLDKKLAHRTRYHYGSLLRRILSPPFNCFSGKHRRIRPR